MSQITSASPSHSNKLQVKILAAALRREDAESSPAGNQSPASALTFGSSATTLHENPGKHRQRQTQTGRRTYSEHVSAKCALLLWRYLSIFGPICPCFCAKLTTCTELRGAAA